MIKTDKRTLSIFLALNSIIGQFSLIFYFIIRQAESQNQNYNL